ncbi:unnamed protein product [Prunus armeniaca]|uniref:Uncharacterized protein n=1 Tax=Prunus armeniaca TaxID=36596 RepID=A0A6J5TLP6_PRUAR|nr:unnamed protein product [Prunus armeniaca]
MDITGVGSMEIEKGTFVILTNDGSLTNYKSTRGRAIKRIHEVKVVRTSLVSEPPRKAVQSYKTQNKSATVSSSLFAMTC